MSALPSYSTLEVNPKPPHHDSSGLELFLPRQKASPEEQYLYSVEQENTRNTANNEDAAHETLDENHEPPKAKKAICGVRRPKIYLIIVIAVLAVLGAIAGAVAGSLSGRRQKDDIISRTLNILPTSNLAASNLTSSDGNERNVFFQDSNNALILRRFDSNTNTWETKNISDSMVKTTPLDLLSGTPLAATSCNDWGCKNSQAYFLTSNNSIRGVTNAHLLDGTFKYDVSLAQANLNTIASSQLAAVFSSNTMPRNSGFNILAFQSSEGALSLSNSSNLTNYINSYQLPRVVSGTSLALIPQLAEESLLLSRVKLCAEVTSTSTAGSLTTLDFDGSAWNTGDQIMDNISLGTSVERFAVTQLDRWADILYMFLTPDGSITGQVVGQNNRSISKIDIRGGPSVNFTTIATTLDAMLYGISNDTILEYAINNSDIPVLNYVGIVYP
ncbi:putative Fucose-specific lectin [Seiridium cardinale]